MWKLLLNKIRRKYLYTLDPDGSWLALASKTMLAGFIALILTELFLPSPAKIFLVLSAILFTLHNPDDCRKQHLIGIIFAGIIGSIGVLLVSIFESHLLIVLPLIFLFALVAVYAGRYGQHLALAGTLALLLIVIAAGIPSDYQQSLWRFYFIISGVLIALFINWLIFPKKPAKKMQRNLLITLLEMNQYFYHTTTDCLRGNHLRTRHWQIRDKIWLFLNRCRQLKNELAHTRHEQKNYLIHLLTQEEQLSESLFALANLLTNPANNSMYAQVSEHLTQFCLVTHELFLNMMENLRQKPIPVDTTQFETAIKQLQEQLSQRWQMTLQRETIFAWPFDLFNLNYILMDFKNNVLQLNAFVASGNTL